MSNTQGALGGSFNPAVDYPITGNWAIKSGATLTIDSGATLAVNGTMTDTGSTLVSPAITGTVTGGASYTAPTLTAVTITGTSTIGNGMTLTTPVEVTPTISTGLLASGSAANDFSASTGTFLTSTGANTLGGAVSIADATTPSLTTATGKTNTGFVTVLGKTSGGLKLTAADSTAQTVTVTAAAQTVGASTLTIPDQAGASSNFLFTSLAQAVTLKTLTGNIEGDYKVLAAPITYTSNVVPAVITGFSWTVVPGTYLFEMNFPTVMTVNGGLTISFVLTTAVLTSIQYQSYASTAVDNTLAVSTTGTTTTSATKVFDSKTSAYTYVKVWGTMVVGTGGTFQWDGCQNTSAGGADVTTLPIGAFSKMTRVL